MFSLRLYLRSHLRALEEVWFKCPALQWSEIAPESHIEEIELICWCVVVVGGRAVGMIDILVTVQVL